MTDRASRQQAVERVGLTEGDRRAEADRIAKARGPAYAEGFAAGLQAAMDAVQRTRNEMDARYDHGTIVGCDIAIEAIGNEFES